MCAIGVTSESKTLEPFYDIVCCCLDARDFLAPSDGDNCNLGNKKSAVKKEGREKEKGKEKKGRKSLAREEIFGKGLIFAVIWREMTCKIRE